MPKIFTTLDKIKPAYDVTYKVVLFICKLLLIADILITTMSVIGRYVPFIPDPAWTEEVVLTCMSYMAVLSAALAIRRGAHIRMTAFDVYLPKIVVKVLDILADLAVCILGPDGPVRPGAVLRPGRPLPEDHAGGLYPDGAHRPQL